MSDFACVTTSLTRLSASAWLRPVRAATTFETYSRSEGFKSLPLRKLETKSGRARRETHLNCLAGMQVRKTVEAYRRTQPSVRSNGLLKPNLELRRSRS